MRSSYELNLNVDYMEGRPCVNMCMGEMVFCVFGAGTKSFTVARCKPSRSHILRKG